MSCSSATFATALAERLAGCQQRALLHKQAVRAVECRMHGSGINAIDARESLFHSMIDLGIAASHLLPYLSKCMQHHWSMANPGLLTNGTLWPLGLETAVICVAHRI